MNFFCTPNTPCFAWRKLSSEDGAESPQTVYCGPVSKELRTVTRAEVQRCRAEDAYFCFALLFAYLLIAWSFERKLLDVNERLRIIC